MFLKLLFYISTLFQNFLKIIPCFLDNFSQVFPKIDAEMLRNFLLECHSKFFDTYRYFKNIEKWIDILKISIRIDIFYTANLRLKTILCILCDDLGVKASRCVFEAY